MDGWDVAQGIQNFLFLPPFFFFLLHLIFVPPEINDVVRQFIHSSSSLFSGYKPFHMTLAQVSMSTYLSYSELYCLKLWNLNQMAFNFYFSFALLAHCSSIGLTKSLK